MALISSGLGIGVAVGIGVVVPVSVGVSVGRGEAVEEGTIIGVGEEAGSVLPQALVNNVNRTNIHQYALSRFMSICRCVKPSAYAMFSTIPKVETIPYSFSGKPSGYLLKMS
jgi:hypothetical protein